jgi:hypothetical protein
MTYDSLSLLRVFGIVFQLGMGYEQCMTSGNNCLAFVYGLHLGIDRWSRPQRHSVALTIMK